jgi:glutamine synthetase
METMKQIAPDFGLACLLHEKPFAGVNGSGKHNNWSMSTSTGENLLDPGKTPFENARFLLFLAAVIKAVDDHQDLLRLSVATAGNDHRLGANEAPPAIISMFLGDELTAIIDAIKAGKKYNAPDAEKMTIGVDALPVFRKDATDRNRTSPFAFTGNKFEFRMVGSALSISGPNFILNTIVADAIKELADKLEAADDFNATLDALIKETFEKHERIIFNGDGYSDEWLVEAEKRGLLNLPNTVEALEYFVKPENITLLDEHKVLSPIEVESREELLLENYSKIIHIEALTMLDMAKREIIPAVVKFSTEIASAIIAKKAAIADIDVSLEEDLLKKLADATAGLKTKVEALDDAIVKAGDIDETLTNARFYGTEVFFSMQELRAIADEAEMITDTKIWPFPTYADLLYSVK